MATDPAHTTAPRGFGRTLARGITKRCAYCGSGRLFRRWVLMVPDCPRCGRHFEREEGFFLGAYVINLAVAELAVAVLLLVGFALTLPDVPTTQLAFGGGALALVLPLVFYPFSKTIWTAVDALMRRSMGESFATSDGRQTGFAAGSAVATGSAGTTRTTAHPPPSDRARNAHH